MLRELYPWASCFMTEFHTGSSHDRRNTQCHSNNPFAGPAETLLRPLLPLSDKVCIQLCSFQNFTPLLHQESSRSGYLFPLDPYLALASAARVYCLLCVHLHYWGSSRASSLHYVDRMGASFRARAWITTPGIPTSATLPHIGFGGQQTVAPAPLWICTAQLTSPHPQC